MKISLLLTGKTTEPHITNGLALYEQRIKHYTSFELITLPDARNLTLPAAIKEKEALTQLKRLTPADHLILLDEAGKQFSSAQFAQYLQQLMNRSVRQVNFLVGGAYGFHDSVYHRIRPTNYILPDTFRSMTFADKNTYAKRKTKTNFGNAQPRRTLAKRIRSAKYR